MATEETKAPAESGNPEQGIQKPQISIFTLSNIKDVLGVAQAVATIIAVILGGWWFVKQRSTEPKLRVEHQISHFQLDKDHFLLVVDVDVTNISKVSVPMLCGHTQPLLVLPLTEDIQEKIKANDDPTSGRRGVDWYGAAPQKCEGATVCEAGQEPICSAHSDLIEPDETDVLHYEFVIPDWVRTVAVYSYFKDTTKPSEAVGWQRTTLHVVAP